MVAAEGSGLDEVQAAVGRRLVRAVTETVGWAWVAEATMVPAMLQVAEVGLAPLPMTQQKARWASDGAAVVVHAMWMDCGQGKLGPLDVLVQAHHHSRCPRLVRWRGCQKIRLHVCRMT